MSKSDVYYNYVIILYKLNFNYDYEFACVVFSLQNREFANFFGFCFVLKVLLL